MRNDLRVSEDKHRRRLVISVAQVLRKRSITQDRLLEWYEKYQDERNLRANGLHEELKYRHPLPYVIVILSSARLGAGIEGVNTERGRHRINCPWPCLPVRRRLLLEGIALAYSYAMYSDPLAYCQ
jgi:hypothetical protein